MFPRKHLFHKAKVNLENLIVVLSTILASIDDCELFMKHLFYAQNILEVTSKC